MSAAMAAAAEGWYWRSEPIWPRRLMRIDRRMDNATLEPMQKPCGCAPEPAPRHAALRREAAREGREMPALGGDWLHPLSAPRRGTGLRPAAHPWPYHDPAAASVGRDDGAPAATGGAARARAPGAGIAGMRGGGGTFLVTVSPPHFGISIRCSRRQLDLARWRTDGKVADNVRRQDVKDEVAGRTNKKPRRLVTSGAVRLPGACAAVSVRGLDEVEVDGRERTRGDAL